VNQDLGKDRTPWLHFFQIPLVCQSVAFDELTQNLFIELQNLQLEAQTHNPRQLTILRPQRCILGLTSDDPEPQIGQQSVVDLSAFKPELAAEAGEGEAGVAQRDLLGPIDISDVLGEDELAGLGLDLFGPQSEWHAIILIIGVGEAIPKQQEAVAPPPIAIENLLPLVQRFGGGHNEASILLLVPPLEGHSILELSVDLGFGRLKHLLFTFVNYLEQLLEETLCTVVLHHFTGHPGLLLVLALGLRVVVFGLR